jgi:hypothetical protein
MLGPSDTPVINHPWSNLCMRRGQGLCQAVQFVSETMVGLVRGSSPGVYNLRGDILGLEIRWEDMRRTFEFSDSDGRRKAWLEGIGVEGEEGALSLNFQGL